MPVKSAARLRILILYYIADCIKAEGCPPSIREITEAFNISSTSVVDYHLEKLKAAGHIRRTPGKARTLVIVGDLPPLDAEIAVEPHKPRTAKPRRYNGYFERGAPIADVVMPLPYPVSMPRQQRRK